MIFNTVVDAVVQVFLDVVCGPHRYEHGLGWAEGERDVIFYANDSRVAGWDHEWVQDALPLTVAIFRRMGLEKNPEKSKTMVFTPGYIWGKWIEYAYNIRATGEGATYQERKILWVS